MKDDLDYEDDILIDPDRLDVEWINQPVLFNQYSRKCAEAKRQLDEVKSNLDVVRAETAKKVRSDPKKYKIEKVTESQINDAVMTSVKYMQANDELIEARFEADLLLSAVRAFDQRKTALENLVRLLGQDYFAAPITPHELTREKVEEIRKKDAKDRMRSGKGVQSGRRRTSQ